MAVRDHEPITLENLKGLWQRGDPENVPLDHFEDCRNIKFVGNNFATRDGIGISQTVAVPLSSVKRIYNYPTQTANTLLILVQNAGGSGEIYHVVNASTIFGPILTIPTMTDFAFIPYAGRAYITPFTSFTTGDINIQKGISGQFLYVYKGDGTAARKAAGVAPVGALTIANGAAGNTDGGKHLFAVIYETDSGFLTAPGVITLFTTSPTFSVSFGTVPTSGSATVVKRHIVATKVITNYNGNTTGYQFFFIPTGTIPNNVDTFLNNISFFDADLLEDASHLIDNFAEIPAGCALTLYHNSLCLSTTFADISLILVSSVGEPEAISQIDGLIVVPPDGNPITNMQELRDILYVFKRSRTVSYVDNEDVPSSWALSVIDNALGCPVHGIATVLDSGSSIVDFLIITSYTGIQLFNGRYVLPELSFKIQDLWYGQNRNEFRRIQIVNAPIQKEIYCVLPNSGILVGNYSNGIDPKSIRWSPWAFDVTINSVAIVNIDKIIIGADI